ncbi:MAG TPA: adenylate/guanylate cyclase domain-containing protein [Candidatus Limnocylindrales bacterium]|nr:adenylate/guanylate cyclase domain-containing protein [Candidatus Limnocylindrales bacterium]
MGFTRAEVAARAGVDVAFVDRLCELGALSAPEGTFTEGDMRRARILHALADAGLPLEAIGEGVRRHAVDLGFVDDPAYELFTGLTDETFAAVSARTGIPFEVLAAMREASGAAAPKPEDRLRSLELDTLPALELEITYGMRPERVERLLRAWGDSLRRMAEVEADLWSTEVMGPLFAAGGGFADLGPRTSEFSNALQPLAAREIIALYRGQQSNAWMRNFFEGFEAGLVAAGLYARADRPPAICFLDLSGYTRLTDERGDAAAADLAGRLSRLVQRTSAEHGGKPIKWLGDGVMFHFRDPGPGVVAALEMVEEAREAGLPPAHVGLHAGPVLFQGGDYFGRTVNVAARIADYARRGEVLVSDEVIEASGELAGVTFDPIGPVELKGLTEAVSLHVARRAA